ncbi:agmatine deiminase [Clostridium boliviensis]|uniref:Putative agmatine deiminase n=1 Tax=Clostridium boliviensis TaxID=318465 RepID=A0ABU4GNW3_9CLOT|nr:agmatine deiminase [Clostridium boliviensis]MDW2798690.1 agmatine deiminase [Clostridium boliviensis]
MKKLSTFPAEDGFFMPGEFEPHRGCIMIWPRRPGSWPYDAASARKAFTEIAEAIADSEQLIMLAEEDTYENARAMLSERIEVMVMESDDAWARDVGPTFVKDKTGRVRGIDWKFNAWGGTFDGLYPDWVKDNLLAERFCEKLGYVVYDATDFVLEGGSIHSDGEGTVLVTERCLLSEGRNPLLTKDQIEARLKKYLGAEKIIWLKYGIYQDETNEHVDNVCAFVRPGEVVLAWTDNREDPQYEMSLEDLRTLERETDAKGRHFIVHKLPIPKVPVCITKEELAGFVFEPGEDEREPGERLAASYVNFYISNGGVIVPQFGDENDREAVRILTGCFLERKIYPVYARDIIVGGGNIHCITQQIPKGEIDEKGNSGSSSDEVL